jgi:hypothetical protein
MIFVDHGGTHGGEHGGTHGGDHGGDALRAALTGAVGMVCPMGFSPWPELDTYGDKKRVVWRGRARPMVGEPPDLTTATEWDDEDKPSIEDASLGSALPDAQGVARWAFTGWAVGNSGLAAIAELMACPRKEGEADPIRQALLDRLPKTAPEIKNELAMIKQLIPFRQGVMAEALAQRNGIVAYFQTLCGFTTLSHRRTSELCAMALAIGGFYVMRYKKMFDRVRPSTLCPELMPPIPVPGHAAFPSGHATESHLIAKLLNHVIKPDDHPAKQLLGPMAHRIAINREVLGLHYRSDSVAGAALADEIMKIIDGAAGAHIRMLCEEAAKEWPGGT